MAQIKEFTGYRFDGEKCGDISDVVAFPYDMMTDEERDLFLSKSEYNIARISKGKDEADDNADINKYTRAADCLYNWMESGILKRESKPAIYLYEQHSIYKNTVFVNHGVVVLLKLEELDGKGSIKFCEETKTGHIEDRYRLLSKTEANVDMINCMYIDSERPLTHLMNEIAEQKPDMEFRLKESVTNEFTENRLWVIDDEKVIDFIKKCIENTTLFITDGHNRYNAALQHMKECRDNNPNHTGEEPYNYIMAFLNNAYGDNLIQLPVHRLLSTKKKFSEDYFIACAQDYFKVEKIIVDTSNDDLTETMKKQIATARRKNIFGVYCGGNYFYRLTLTDENHVQSLLPEHSKEYCLLDTTVLNHLIIGELLNIDTENMDEYISVTKRTTTGVELVNENKASCLFVLNAPKPERICEVVDSGETLPGHSLYIFPRAVTGVVINKL